LRSRYVSVNTPPLVDFSRASHLDLFEQPGMTLPSPLLQAVRKMKLTVGFTYVIIVGVISDLVGRAFYFFTHSFAVAVEQPKLHDLAFGILSSFFLYGLSRRMEPVSAKRVLVAVAAAALLRTVSYAVSSYVPNQWSFGLILYLSVVGAEIVVMYLCLIHLKELRSTRQA
jgi:hypothetical protein